MKFTGETKVFLGIIASSIAIIALAAIVLTKPAPTLTRDELIPNTAHTKGSIKASVYLVEFSDFQCPACKAVKPLVDEILKNNKKNIYFAYRHFPLTQHPFAQKAAEAAEAAGAQGKFWEAYDFLFANQEKFSDAFFADLPKALALDEKKFAEDLASGAYRAGVLTDQADGTRFDVTATPTFFLNGKKLELTSFENLKTTVEEAVKTNE